MADTTEQANVCQRCAQSLVMALDEQLMDPNSDIVREALTRTCDLCGAKVGQVCRNVIQPGQPLPGRIIHIGRKSPR